MLDIVIFNMAIQNLRQGAGFSVDGTDLSTVVFTNNSVQAITQEELNLEVARLQAEAEAAEQSKIDAKQKAINKLMALGLTEEEALALGK